MAEVLEDFVFTPRQQMPDYPWKEWFDGKVRAIYQGKDFNTSLRNFRALAYQQAKKRNMKLHTRLIAEPKDDKNPHIILQAYDANAENADTP